jgi:hypothetical protein
MKATGFLGLKINKKKKRKEKKKRLEKDREIPR